MGREQHRTYPRGEEVLRITEAREIVRPCVARAASTPLSLSKLAAYHDREYLGDDDDYLGFDRETQWCYLLLTRWHLYQLHELGVTKRWPPQFIEAVEMLHSRVLAKQDLDRELLSVGSTSFDVIHREAAGDPLGERWARGDENEGGDVSYSWTDRPNHSALSYDDEGRSVYQSNKIKDRAESDAKEASAEIRRLLELDADHEGLTFDALIASPGRGRVSAAVGARLDTLSRSVCRLLDLGFTQAQIGAVIDRDKRRMSDLVSRTRP